MARITAVKMEGEERWRHGLIICGKKRCFSLVEGEGGEGVQFVLDLDEIFHKEEVFEGTADFHNM